MITKEKLIKTLLNKKKLWNRYSKLCFKNNKKINLSFADLSSADLSFADLSFADLSFANLRSADLRFADLSSANLRFVDLSSANLSFADLSSANLDFSCLDLSCKTLNTKFDEKHIIQFLYHALKPIQNYPEIIKDKDIKRLLKNKTLLKVVNKFNRDECDKINF